MQTSTANGHPPSAPDLELDRGFIEHLTSVLPFLSWQDALPANGVLLRYHCTGSLTERQRETVRELSAKIGQIYRTERDLLTACACSNRDQLAAKLAQDTGITLRFRDGHGFCFLTPGGRRLADWLVYPFCQHDLESAIIATNAKSLAEREEPA